MLTSSLNTITVGVAVIGESPNIIYLLRSILKQKQTNLVLEEIIVNCEGASDELIEKIKNYSTKHPLVKIITDLRIKGKKERIQEIFLQSKSNYTFIFDDKVIISKTDVLVKMSDALFVKEATFVHANFQPISIKGIRAQIIKKWHYIWYEIGKKFNEGDNIDTVQSLAFGIKTEFAKNIIFPKEIVSESQYIYILTKSHNLLTQFISDVSVLLFTPKTFNDYKILQGSSTEKAKILEIFGKKIYADISVPSSFKLKSLLMTILKNPLNIPIVFIFGVLKIIPAKRDLFDKDTIMALGQTKRKAHSY